MARRTASARVANPAGSRSALPVSGTTGTVTTQAGNGSASPVPLALPCRAELDLEF
jgi:hypothetical protein